MEYNWDSIDVGKPELNSSQNFFAKRHVLHEKLNAAADKRKNFIESVEQPESKRVVPQQQQKVVAPNPVTTSTTGKADKENVSVNKDRAIMAISMVQKPEAVALSKPSILKSVLKKSVSVSSSTAAQASSSRPQASSAQVKKLPTQLKEDKKQDKKAASMVPRQTFVKKTNVGQRQFEYAEIQKKRKEELVKKIKEQEDKELKFNFQANPVPKFKKVAVAHKQTSVDDKKIAKRPPMMKQNSLPQIPLSRKFSKENIVPSCGDPERLKFMNERKKRLLQKYQETQVQFKAKPADVLRKQPFQPVHNQAKAICAKPFKLQLTERLHMRSEFDKKLSETQTFRKKQEEVRQRINDLQLRKVMRQKTEFKARANPFSHNH